jgi:hypothetical protein
MPPYCTTREQLNKVFEALRRGIEGLCRTG